MLVGDRRSPPFERMGRKALREMATKAYFLSTTKLALTATATSIYKAYIQASLGMRDPYVYQRSINRSNLTFEIYISRGQKEEMNAFVELFQENKAIIFCPAKSEVVGESNLILSSMKVLSQDEENCCIR
mgnify:CR=1 FL=1